MGLISITVHGLSPIIRIILAVQWFEPAAARWEAQTLPVCYATLLPSNSVILHVFDMAWWLVRLMGPCFFLICAYWAIFASSCTAKYTFLRKSKGLHLLERPELRTHYWEDGEDKIAKYPAGFKPTTFPLQGLPSTTVQPPLPFESPLLFHSFIS